jgi:hypothetical protein
MRTSLKPRLATKGGRFELVRGSVASLKVQSATKENSPPFSYILSEFLVRVFRFREGKGSNEAI